MLDHEGNLLAGNRSAEALFGYDQAEIAGETFISLFAPDSHATALDYLEGLKANGVASVLNDGREVIGRVRQGREPGLDVVLLHQLAEVFAIDVGGARGVRRSRSTLNGGGS